MSQNLTDPLLFMQIQSIQRRLDTIEVALLKIQQELARLNLNPHIQIVNAGRDTEVGGDVTGHDKSVGNDQVGADSVKGDKVGGDKSG